MESLNLKKLLNRFLDWGITFILHCGNDLLTLTVYTNVFSNSNEMFLNMEEQLTIPF